MVSNASFSFSSSLSLLLLCLLTFSTLPFLSHISNNLLFLADEVSGCYQVTGRTDWAWLILALTWKHPLKRLMYTYEPEPEPTP